MGVPKFYRWISERYPKINQIVSDHALLPEFDHLYLDMNGIIHGCTHPSDRDISDGLSEKEMMLGILQYIDRIVTIAKPHVSLYMAIDGVAPRAKLNQQRSRRFRSAKDLAEATKEMKSESKAAVFDSNCITPGTEFLAKVSTLIRFYIRKKIRDDPLWRHLSVVFSGHDIPGEGEHKIMQHIRTMRNAPNYQPNNRHCMYGQDADLIMLCLVTHEPHFTILREVVNFNTMQNGNNKNTLKAVKKFTKQSDFQLMHISILREYLQLDFVVNHQLDDLERCVDDFVFLTFLVGNDFLPHMPTLDIGDNAFDLLFKLYKGQKLTWGAGQYLTDRGEISDPSRLEGLLAAIGEVETEILKDRDTEDAKYLKKKRQWDKRDGKAAGPSDQELAQQEAAKQQSYQAMLDGLMVTHNHDNFVDGWELVSDPDEKDFKGRYYFEKLKLTPVDKDAHWKLRKSYIEGLQWCLAYYYKGCISWGWFYPYHYGPMLSDLRDLPRMFAEIQFELGAPLSPFEQLMGCLPPASSILVPKPYRELMTSPQSPIARFYPLDFEVDMNGKKNPWEGVNLLPFIEIDFLKSTIATHCPPRVLTAIEMERNRVGKVFCYRYDATCVESVESPGAHLGIPEIVEAHTSVRAIDEDLGQPKYVFEPRLLPGTILPYPGFPSLNVIPVKSVDLVPIGLNCFGTASKYPTMVLYMQEMTALPPLEELARTILGRSIYVNWPMMHEARVVAMSDHTMEVRLSDNGHTKVTKWNDLAMARWEKEAELMTYTYHNGNGIPGAGGIQINEVRVRLRATPLQGMRTIPSTGATKKVFGTEEADVPLQLALWQAPVQDPRFVERGPVSLKDRFPVGRSVVLTKGVHRGSTGVVVGVVDEKCVGVKVATYPPEPSFGLNLAQSVQEKYFSSVDAAKALRIHPGIIGKIMGKLQVVQGRFDLGLNLKSAEGSCVVGYTRKKVDQSSSNKADAWTAGDSVLVIGSRLDDSDEEEEERIQWEYSNKAINAVKQYREKFPALFAGLQKQPNALKYDARDLLGPDGEKLLSPIREWLDNHETAKIPRFPVTTNSLPVEVSKAIQACADVRKLALKKQGHPKEVMLKIPGSALYAEGSTGATDVLMAKDLNNDAGPTLGDRVVNLCADGVPFGARGTVIGIHEAATTGSVEVVMDEEFIGGTSLQGHCSNFRGKLCTWSQLLRIEPDAKAVAMQQSLSLQVNQEASAAKANTKILARGSSASNGRDKQTTSNGRDKQIGANPKATTPSRKTVTAASAAASSRTNSSGRGGRQGAWREASGPPEKGCGFRHTKNNGLYRWKLGLLTANATSPATKESTDNLKKILGVNIPGPALSSHQGVAIATSAASADTLKEILGVKSPGPSVPAHDNASTGNIPTQGPPQAPPPSQGQATVLLKSVLGLNMASSPAHPPPPPTPTFTMPLPLPPPPPQIQGASGQLKSLLGVGGVGSPMNPTILTKPSAPSASATAAEKLLVRLNAKLPVVAMGSPSNHLQQQNNDPFNFTYVEEGLDDVLVTPPPPSALPTPNFGAP